MSLDHDTAVRLAAFAALDRLERRHGPVLSWDVISQGFDHDGKHYLFANRARGIFRPQGMDGPALSIKTTIPRKGRTARYDDSVYGGTLTYRFHGTDPNHLDNRLLRAAMQQGMPLIYFAGVMPALYSPLWPAYVTAFKPDDLACEVQIDERRSLGKPFGAVAAAERSVARRYATVEARRRLHQDAFRVVVLDAYRQRCAVCRLPEPAMLEAAHIIPDAEEEGEPEVTNGLALCTLHHSAFDADLLGIRPDGTVHISRRLLEAIDGPTLDHAVKGFHNRPVMNPPDRRNYPDPVKLGQRYKQFLAAQ